MRTFFINKPAGENITDTHELLRQIERKDAAFRITQAIFFALISVGLALLLLVTYRVQTNNNKLLKAQSNSIAQQKQIVDQLANNDKDTKKSIADLQNHIDCVVALFQQPNHETLSIADLQNCSLISSASGGSTGSTKSTLNTNKPQGSSSPSTNNDRAPANNPTPHPPAPTPGQLLRTFFNGVTHTLKGLL